MTNYSDKANAIVQEMDNRYQLKLVSGTNIKTINNNSLLGSGNISIQGGGGSDIGTFTDLQTLITSASSGDILILNKDYQYDSTTDSSLTNGISISKNITIIGNGHIIDGNNTQRAFYIGGNFTITLSDLRIQNGNGTNGGGGIVTLSNATVNIDNIQFTNNAAQYGGAIFANTGTTININNSQFINNSATGTNSFGGGILAYTNATVNIRNSNFQNNTASIYGNVYSANKIINMYDCIISNIATTCYNVSNITTESLNSNKQNTLVSGTNIKSINNESLLGSGNITIQGGGVEVGSFTDLNTIIRNANEGDIITLDKDYKYNATTDTNLTSGIDLKGVTINGNGHIIDGNNSAVIFKIIDTGMVKLNNLIIQNANNNGLGFDGGAINIGEQSYPTIINNCTFINNYCKYLGGVIYINGDWNNIVDINDCTFINNKSDLGGAIYSFGSVDSYKNTINVNNSIFIANESKYCGSAILGYVTNDININNCVFEKNICTEEGGDGCIYYENQNTDSELVIKNSLFRNNSGDTYNNIYSNVATKVYDCEIDDVATTCYNITNITIESLVDMIGDAIAYINGTGS